MEKGRQNKERGTVTKRQTDSDTKTKQNTNQNETNHFDPKCFKSFRFGMTYMFLLCFVYDSVWRFVTVSLSSLFVCPFPCVRPCRIKKDTDPGPAAFPWRACRIKRHRSSPCRINWPACRIRCTRESLPRCSIRACRISGPCRHYTTTTRSHSAGSGARPGWPGGSLGF